jgi:hypothetical protein
MDASLTRSAGTSQLAVTGTGLGRHGGFVTEQFPA